LSAVSSGRRRVPENKILLHLRPPPGYGDRATRVQVYFNERTGLPFREIGATEDGDEMLTGGGDGRDLRVRRVTARSWLEGGESDEDTGIEDLDDQLFRIIATTPRPWTVSRVLRIAVAKYPERAPRYLRSKISTLMLSMKRTAKNILIRSIRNAPAVNPQTSMIVPLDLDVTSTLIHRFENMSALRTI